MRNPTTMSDMRALRVWTFTRVCSRLGANATMRADLTTAEVIAAQLDSSPGRLYIPRKVN